MKHITNGDFPRTKWNESLGVRSVLIRAFNTSRKNRNRLLAMQVWLRFLTKKVNTALVELETGQPLAVVKEEPAVVPIVIEPVPVVQQDALVIPKLDNQLMDV